MSEGQPIIKIQRLYPPDLFTLKLDIFIKFHYKDTNQTGQREEGMMENQVLDHERKKRPVVEPVRLGPALTNSPRTKHASIWTLPDASVANDYGYACG